MDIYCSSDCNIHGEEFAAVVYANGYVDDDSVD